jgi:hypothetical protein
MTAKKEEGSWVSPSGYVMVWTCLASQLGQEPGSEVLESPSDAMLPGQANSQSGSKKGA